MKKTHGSAKLSALALLAATVALPASAAAQGSGAWSLQLRGGVADFGSFLEERVPGGEREVTAELSPVIGGAVGYEGFEKTRIQADVMYAPATVEYEDDTPGGDGGLDRTDVADLNTWIFSIEAIRYLFDDRDAVFQPYTILGFSGGVWGLDIPGTGAVVAAGDEDSVFRWGGVGGLGADLRLSDALTLTLQFSNVSLGSPFDGDDGFETVGGETIDEHERVNVREFSLGATLGIGGG